MWAFWQGVLLGVGTAVSTVGVLVLSHLLNRGNIPSMLRHRVSRATLGGIGVEQLPLHAGFPIQAIKILGGMVQDIRHRHSFDVGDGLRHVTHKRRFITAPAVGEGARYGLSVSINSRSVAHAQSRTDVVGLGKTDNACEANIKTHGQ